MPRKTYIVYRCTLPDCNHYIRKELLPGKRSICWRCGEPFIVTPELARLAKPHCKKCTVEEPKERIKLPTDFTIPGVT